MRRLLWSLPILLVLAGGAGAVASDSKKAPPEPFYRKYLVPGTPLDDKIIEQEKRVEAHPDDANLRNDFGNLLAERRFPNEAAEQYEIAMKLDKKNFVSAYNLGLVRESQGRTHDAIAALQKSIKRKPGFPQSRFRLGRLYEHSNQPESAVREYAEALWIDPNMRDPRRNPLIVDCELIYLASLANYRQNIAVAAMTDSHVYFDVDRFRKLPTTRAIGSKEVEGEAPAETAPRDVGAPASPGVTGASEPARRTPRTAPVAGAPPPGMLGAPAERPTPVPRRPTAPGRPQPAPSAAPSSPAPPPAESVEPTPVPEAPPEAETPPEAEPS